MKNISVSFINLDRRTDRMDYMESTLSKLNVPYTRISAIDSKDDKNNWLVEGKPGRITEIPMHRGEHAVHASHYKVWKDAINRDLDAVIVLEDDVITTSDFPKLLEPDWIPEDADIIKIEAYWGEVELGPVSNKIFGRQLRRLHSMHLGAAGYVATAKGLKKLEQLISPEEIFDPIDRAIFDRHSPIFSELIIYQIYPAMVQQAEFSDTSSVQNLARSDLAAGRKEATRNGAAYGNANSLKRKTRRLANRLRSRLRGRKRVAVNFR